MFQAHLVLHPAPGPEPAPSRWNPGSFEGRASAEVGIGAQTVPTAAGLSLVPGLSVGRGRERARVRTLACVHAHLAAGREPCVHTDVPSRHAVNPGFLLVHVRNSLIWSGEPAS